MRTRSGLFCAVILGAWLVASAAAQQAVRWQPTLETAKRVAGQTNRLVLIHFWSDGCPPCERMEQDVFSRPDVAAALERDFVPVKINRSYFPATAAQYGISAVPTDVIITPQGQFVEKYAGVAPASQYVGRLNQVAANYRNAATRTLARATSAQPSASSNPARPWAGGPGYNLPPNNVPPNYSSDAYFSDATQYRTDGFSGRYPQPQAEAVVPGARYTGQAFADRRSFASGVNRSEVPAGPYNPSGLDPSRATYAPPSTAQVGIPSQESRSPLDRSAYRSPEASYRVGVGDSQLSRSGRQDALMGQRVASRPYEGFSSGPPQVPSDRTESRRPQASGVGQGSAGYDTPKVQTAAGNPPLGLDGYCPVQLNEKKRWVLGNRRWGVRHEGRTYLFAGPEEQERFFNQPDRYAPALSGNDVVLVLNGGQAVPGRREHGAWFRGRMYLFSSEATFEKFEAAPYDYVNGIQQAMNSAPHTASRPYPEGGQPPSPPSARFNRPGPTYGGVGQPPAGSGPRYSIPGTRRW